MSADLLATIVAATRRIVETREGREPRPALERRALAVSPRPGQFQAALARPGRINVIAECKRRSPSRGVLQPSYDPVATATAYAENGAAAISVLTEPTFFDGALEHLEAVRQAVEVALLRKDFIVSDYQLLEARAAGADAVILIAAALRPVELKLLHDHAVALGLDVLVEVHDATELAVAIEIGAKVIGVNNRNLRTLEVSAETSSQLIALMPAQVVAVSESGFKRGQDLLALAGQGGQEVVSRESLVGRESRVTRGYQAFLIGERFMTSPDPGGALRALLEDCGQATAPSAPHTSGIDGARA